MTKQETWREFEQRVQTRALELTRGQSPSFNIAPIMDLVRQAFSHGYDVVPSPDEPATEQAVPAPPVDQR